MTDHLTPEELDNFLTGKLVSSRRKSLFLHILKGCPECKGIAGKAFYWGSQTLTPDEDAAYDEIVRSSIAQALRFEKLRRQADEKERVAALLATGEGLQGLVRRGDVPLRGLWLFEALLDRIEKVRHDNPREVVELARVGLQVALDLDPAEHGTEQASDFQARAWAELGNALRVAEEYTEAGRAFGNAFLALRRGTGDRLLRARLHELNASLLGSLRRLDYALDAMDFVYNVYLEAGEVHLAGRLLIKKSIYTFYHGHPDEALKINQKGRLMVDSQRDPGLLVTALHNDLLFLEGCGRFSEAKNLLFKNRDLLSRTGKITRLKLQWAEARIELALGNLISAENGFSDVRAGMIEASLGFNASLASLELALVWMLQRRAEEAEEIVHEAAEVFYSLGLHLEVLGAVQLLVDAFRFKKASALLVQRTVSFIREWEINPDARFLPPNE